MKSNLTKNTLSLAIQASMLVIATQSINAYANDNVQQLATIEVTAEKSLANGKIASQSNLGSLGNKSIIDTPFTVTTYTQKLIEDVQASSVADVLKTDPAIRSTTNAGHLNENFMIRGFSAGWEDYNLNGLYGVAPTGRIPTDILGSVTLLKGPNALVAGMAPTGGVGGVIMAHTKRADHDLTQVSATYEDGGYYKSGFDMARRFGENKEFGVRAAGSYGQGEHIIEGMEDKNAAGVLALDYTTDQLKLNFDSYIVSDKRDGGSPAMVCFSCSNPTLGVTGVGKILNEPDGNSNYFPKLEGQQQSQYVGLTSEYKFNPNIKAFAGLAYGEREYVGHLFGTRMMVGTIIPTKANGLTKTYAGDEGYALAQYYRVHSKEHNTAANVGFEGKFNTGAISHTVGLRADYLTRDYWQHYNAPASYFVTNLYDPEVGAKGEMPTSYPTWGPYGDNKYVSYTLTDQLSMLNDKLQLILGARYQDMDISTFNATSKLWGNYSSDKVSPSLGVVVKPFGDDLSFYASYVEGLSQGVEVTALNYPKAVNKGVLAPYQTKQYEVGSKYQVGSWLHTLALYQIEKPGILEENISATETKVTDDAETRSRGVEWAFSGKLTQDLSLMGNLAYIDAKYVKAKANEGNSVEGVPEFTAGLGLDYAIPFVDGLSVNANATYVGEQYLTTDNTLELPDYTVLGLGTKYMTKLGGVNTTFRANVENLTNEKYWAGVFQNGYATIGEGRTYKVGVTFDF